MDKLAYFFEDPSMFVFVVNTAKIIKMLFIKQSFLIVARNYSTAVFLSKTNNCLKLKKHTKFSLLIKATKN